MRLFHLNVFIQTQYTMNSIQLEGEAKKKDE